MLTLLSPLGLGLILSLASICGLIFYIFKLKAIVTKYAPIIDVESQLNTLQSEINDLRSDYSSKKSIYDNLVKEVSIYEDRFDSLDYGFMEPFFQYDDPETYKEAILTIRDKQKALVTEKLAVICLTKWRVDGSLQKGKKMTNENIKLTIRAFNNECSVIIDSVSWKNFDQSKAKIEKAYDFFNKYNASSSIKIREEYLALKMEELRLAFERQEIRQKIKDEQRELRERQREEEKFEKERIAAEKEEEKYRKLLEKARLEASKATGANLEKLQHEVEDLTKRLREAEEKNQRAISMAQQTRAGYVYIISNIGAFGQDVFKIGMTRRLEPLERVYELGDASVPFEFDVHAMIASNDAPTLENKLHSSFEEYKMNLVNNRREFFRVNIEDLESKVKEFSPNTNFIRSVPSEQFLKSEAIRRNRVERAATQSKQKTFPDSI